MHVSQLESYMATPTMNDMSDHVAQLLKTVLIIPMSQYINLKPLEKRISSQYLILLIN